MVKICGQKWFIIDHSQVVCGYSLPKVFLLRFTAYIRDGGTGAKIRTGARRTSEWSKTPVTEMGHINANAYKLQNGPIQKEKLLLGHFEVCMHIQSCGLSLSQQFWAILSSIFYRDRKIPDVPCIEIGSKCKKIIFSMSEHVITTNKSSTPFCLQTDLFA